MNSTLDIQRRLSELGFYKGAIDGIAGVMTKAGIVSFERSAGLVPDGVAGPKTLAKLFPLADPDDVDQPTGDLLTAAVIRKVCPAARADLVVEIAGAGARLRAAGIVTRLRAAHFLPQVATETGYLTAIEEKLSYSVARLVKVWPSRFPTIAAAKPFAKNSEALANKVYDDWLGDIHPGDGWRYRGGRECCRQLAGTTTGAPPTRTTPKRCGGLGPRSTPRCTTGRYRLQRHCPP